MTTTTITTENVHTVLTPGTVVTLTAKHGATFTGAVSLRDNASGETFVSVPGFTVRLSPLGMRYGGATRLQVTIG